MREATSLVRTGVASLMRNRVCSIRRAHDPMQTVPLKAVILRVVGLLSFEVVAEARDSLEKLTLTTIVLSGHHKPFLIALLW